MRAAALLAVSIAVAPAAAQADTHSSQAAPADEYFGRMRLSIVGIRNEIGLLDARIEADPATADQDLKTCELVENALEDWAVKYPHDSWLDAQMARMETLYARVASLDGRLHLAHLVRWIEQHFAGTPVGDDARREAAGLFGVPLTLTGDSAPSPSPAPTASPSAAPH
jgi:hypothetical protein